MNAIRIIHPRWEDGSLVFDDPAVGLVREPFVAGADVAIGLLAQKVEGCSREFSLLFSDSPFPGHQASMEWEREEYGGNWYFCEQLGMSGWLCPALLKYFDTAPKNLYLQVKRKESR
jgi:hypothetical protein